MESALDSYGDCPICLEELNKNSSLEYMPCCHVFHTNCINTWLNEKPTCPVCKINVLNYSEMNYDSNNHIIIIIIYNKI